MTRKCLLLAAALVLAGCSKSPSGAASGVNPGDPMEKKLADLAGPGASTCGHLKTQVAAEVDAAGKCVMQSAKDKKPFYVAYDLPGLTVAIAGNADGKLFSMQTSASASGGMAVVPCPSELRIAPSGRATCYAPGTFPMGTDSSLHEPLMTMPPNGTNPHQRFGTPPPGTPNPHAQSTAPPKKP